MSIRFGTTVADPASTGAWLDFSGVTRVAISLWVEAHAVGDSGQFVLAFSGLYYSFANVYIRNNAGTPRLEMIFQTTGGDTTAYRDIVLGQAYHVFGVHDESSGSAWYVNGELVGTSADTSPLASGSRPIVLNYEKGSGGFDLSMDDVAIWFGTISPDVPTPDGSDVAGLFDRSVTPDALGSDTRQVYFTMDGVNGATVRAGDAGLANADPGAGAITSIPTPAPVYADQLLYVPPSPTAEIATAIVCPSVAVGGAGTGLAIHLRRLADGVADPIMAIDTDPTIAVNGGASIALSGPIWQSDSGGLRLPYVYYPLANGVVSVGDSVTLTAPEGWATTASGFTGAASARVVTVGDGTPRLPQTPAASGRTMKAGYNLSPPYYYGPIRISNNLLKDGGGAGAGGGDWFDYTHSSTSITFDLDGYPTAITPLGTPLYTRVAYSDDYLGTDDGTRNAPKGVDYILTWDGTAAMALGAQGAGDSITLVEDRFPAENYRRYAVDTTRRAPSIILVWPGSGTVSNAALTTSDVPTGWTSRFRPELLTMLRGAASIRNMQLMGIIASNVREYADLQATTKLSYGQPRSRTSAAITAVANHDNADGYLPPGGRAYARFTTATAHGFEDGDRIGLYGVSASVGVDLTDGGSTAVDIGTAGRFEWYIHKLSDTEFAFDLYVGGSGGTVQAAALTGVVDRYVGHGYPLADTVALANDAGSDLHLCVPAMLSDAGCAAMAAYVAANLAAGKACSIELSNEYWNFAPPYDFPRFHGFASLLGMSLDHWYAKRSAEVNHLFHAAFASAGRAADCIRGYGIQTSYPGRTANMLDYLFDPSGGGSRTGSQLPSFWTAGDGPIPVDVLYRTTYYSNGPAGPDGARWDALDIEQVMDLWELYADDDTGEGYTNASIRAVLEDAAYGGAFDATAIAAYEGGPTLGIGSYSADPTAAAAMSRATARHPRMVGVHLRELAKEDASGLALDHRYTLDHDPVDAGIGVAASAVWGTYFAYDAEAGVPTLGLTESQWLDDPTSPVGLAIDLWEAASAGPTNAKPKWLPNGKKKGQSRPLRHEPNPGRGPGVVGRPRAGGRRLSGR